MLSYYARSSNRVELAVFSQEMWVVIDVYSDILRCFLIRFFGAAAEHENNPLVWEYIQESISPVLQFEVV